MRKFKKSLVLWLLIVIFILTSFSVSVNADGEKPNGNVLKFQLDNKTCVVNGSMVNIDVSPTSLNGRTLIPIVYVANPLGAKVEWDGDAKKVTIVLKDTKLELWIGNPTAKVNGTDTPIDSKNSEVKPIILNARTMLPLRFVAENLGCEVEWDSATKGITISEKTGVEASDADGSKTSGETAKPGEAATPSIGMKENPVAVKTPNLQDALKPSKEEPKDDAKDEEERLKNIRTGFKPGFEDKGNYIAETFGVYYKRRTDTAEVFYTLDELAIERNTLRGKKKSSSLTGEEKSNLEELEKLVAVGIKKLEQRFANEKGKVDDYFISAIDAYYNRTMPPSPTAEGFSRYYLADFLIAGKEIGPYSFEELLKKLKHISSDNTDELLKKAREDRVKELRAKGVSEPEISRKMRALEPPEDPGSDSRGDKLYHFEAKPGELKTYTCDQLMQLRREMRKTAEGKELLELQKDVIDKAIADKKRELGGSEEKLNEYLDKFEDVPSWVLNNKKLSQNISNDNKNLEVVKHLGKGYDVIKANYGESNGVKQPVLDTQALYQYNFLHQGVINEIYQKSIITESLREYSKKLTTDIGISGSYKCFSGSVNTSFASEEAKKTSRYYATHTIIKPDFDFYISMQGEKKERYKKFRYFLTETARKEIDDPKFPVATLVDKYGQYVLTGLVSGAKADYNVSVEKDKVFSKDDFSVKVKAGMKSLVASASVEVGHSSSVSQGSFNKSAEQMIRTIGFGFVIDEAQLRKGEANAIAFQQSATKEKSNMIDYSRVLGKDSLIPLYELAEGARRGAIKTEVEKRLKAAGKSIPEPEDSDIYKNYLVGIRLGLANEGWNDAVAKARGNDEQYGSPHHREPVFWKIMRKNPFEEDGADLNEGVTKRNRDIIVLNLGWLDRFNDSLPPIRDLYIAQNNGNKGWKNDSHNGTSGRWYLLNKDLNNNAGGAYLYLAWSFEGEKKPIVDMVLCVGKPHELYPGWEVVKYKNSNTPANLNEGAKGSEIYLVIKRAP